MMAQSVQMGRSPMVISLGDPGGVGPEVVLNALLQYPVSRPIILVGPFSLRWNPFLIHGFNRLNPQRISQHDGLTHPISWIDPTPTVSDEPFLSEPHSRNGLVSYEAVIMGLKIAVLRKGMLVTAPVCKEAWKKAGVAYIDHTSLLGGWFNTNPTMAFNSPAFKICLATVHVPLSQVPSHVSKESISRCLQHAIGWMGQLGILYPRVAVAGLNPHAGEGGLLGTEEQDIIQPAIHEVQQSHPNAKIIGPIPADTLFYRAYQGDFDVVIALYHDQGLAPLKMVAFDQAVNITLGIPIMRVSPDHGTAFDVAYQSKSRCESMLAAIEYGDRYGG